MDIIEIGKGESQPTARKKTRKQAQRHKYKIRRTKRSTPVDMYPRCALRSHRRESAMGSRAVASAYIHVAGLVGKVRKRCSWTCKFAIEDCCRIGLWKPFAFVGFSTGSSSDRWSEMTAKKDSIRRDLSSRWRS